MEYIEVIEYINDRSKFGNKGNLNSIGKLLELLGNPEKEKDIIHIAGTNGKGSTAAFTSNMLIEAGYKVGMFTSPYIERFNERIQINNENILDSDLISFTVEVKEKADLMLETGFGQPSTFELITAIGFLYFHRKNVDYIVLETGIGGRLDPTNIIERPILSIITTIDYDHVNILGNTLEEIAFEKAGIIKENSLVLSYPQKNSIAEIIRNRSIEKNSDLYILEESEINIKSSDINGSIIEYKSISGYGFEVEIPLLGRYQAYNCSLSIRAMEILNKHKLIDIDRSSILRGIENTRWPGRLEILGNNPMFIVDGCHNLQGAVELYRAIKSIKYKRLILSLAMVKDKDIIAVVERLVPLADLVVSTELDIFKSLKSEELKNIILAYNENVVLKENIDDAVEYALDIAEEDDLIVFGGSLYLIGSVKDKYRQLI